MENEKESILVVDDTADNLRLLSVMLSERGYKVRKALSGKTALNTIDAVPPDLILLDINMPNMNGYEVCRILKSQDKTKDIPVIFISALNDIHDKVEAFKIGGLDYITKPFQSEEVIARIENQLTIQRQQKQLQQEITERQKIEETLTIYLHAVSHDLRNPVLAMSIILDNLLKKSSLENLDKSILEQMRQSCDRQLNLINSLVETQQFDVWGVPLKCEYFDLTQLIKNLAEEWQLRLEKEQVNLTLDLDKKLPLVYGDSHQLWRVFENLLANSLKFNPPQIALKISAYRSKDEPNFIHCTVQDNGIGMTSEQCQNLFQRYQRGKAAQKTLGLGLGLYLCQQIIQAHGGEIGVVSAPQQGAQFWFTLPGAAPS
jgi:two-component system sensor histidine kinase/response regulator